MAAIPHHRFPGIMWRLLHLITAFPENLRQQIYPGSRDPGYFPRTLSGENSGEAGTRGGHCPGKIPGNHYLRCRNFAWLCWHWEPVFFALFFFF